MAPVSRLRGLERDWEVFAKTDPLWAILTHPERRGRKWTPEPFFETGRKEIAAVMADVAALGLEVRRGRALDFGCGVGRLSQALGEHFAFTCGVDISKTMIALARQHNRHGGKVEYLLNREANLELLDDQTFDFVYSNIVLQHMPSSLTRLYLQQFMRVVAPGGTVVFQLTTRPEGPPEPLASRLGRRMVDLLIDVHHRIRHGQPRMRVYFGMAPSDVVRLVETNGGRVVETKPTGPTGPRGTSNRFVAIKSLNRDAPMASGPVDAVTGSFNHPGT